MSASRNLVSHYEKLRWHRCLVVEAMRVIAFRNRDHFYATSVRLGVSDRADPEALALVFDKMLEDQGVAPSEANRWVLGWANWASWDVYMCMLFSLVEDYEKLRRDHPVVELPPLGDFLQSNAGLVDELKAVRDKLLHPLSEAEYLGRLGDLMVAARHAAPDLYLALEQLQGQLDDFLERFRGVLQESLAEEVMNLPPGEMFVYLGRFSEETRSRAERAGNTEIIAEMDAQSRGLGAFHQAVQPFLDADFSPDDVPLNRIERLERTRSALNLPLPKRPYHKGLDSIQTPVVPNLSVWVLMASFGGQVAALEQSLPANVMEHRSGILELLVRSITIFNETHAALAARWKLAFPGLTVEQVMADEELFEEAVRQSIPTDAGAELERAMLEATPYMIALALLAEPLRIYRQVIQDQPELSRDEIDSSTLDEAERVLRQFRNTIFHVPRGQADMFNADTQLAHAPISHGHFLDLVAGLTYFYQGIDPATLFENE